MSEKIAKRVVAAEGWRWMEGMADTVGDRVLEIGPHGPEWTNGCTGADEETLPDLEDPATQGCLLALVREKHGHLAFVRQNYEPHGLGGDEGGTEGWEVRKHLVHGYRLVGEGDTVAEALVAALEAAR